MQVLYFAWVRQKVGVSAEEVSPPPEVADVAGLMRSFAYGAETVIREITARFADSEERARDAATAWRGMIEAAFLAGYEAAVEGSRAAVTDPDCRARLLRLCLLTKALYEVDYEANNRPDWIEIPARGVLTILDDIKRGV